LIDFGLCVACAVQRGEEDKAQSVSTFQLRVCLV